MLRTDMQTLHNLPKNSYLQYIKLFPITQNATVRSYTTLILTLVAVICFGLFAISPTVTTIIELRKQLEDSQLANEALIQKIESLDALQKSYLTMGDTLVRISEAIPTKPEVPSLFAGIQTLALRNDLDIINLRSDEVDLAAQPKAKVPLSFDFEVTVSGDYVKIMQLLEDLKQSNRIVTVESVTITRGLTQNTPLEAAIQGKAYYHPEVK